MVFSRVKENRYTYMGEGFREFIMRLFTERLDDHSTD